MAAVPDFHHVSVLLPQVVEGLAPRPGGRYLDGTLGGGGHAAAVLAASAPDGLLVGIDRDPAALAAAGARLAPFGDRAQLRRGTFDSMATLAADLAPYDGILLDIGVSSPQLDHAERGFSFSADGPVDMRMDPELPESAADLIARLDEDRLTTLIGQLGEEPRARRIARALKAGVPWTSTVALAETVAAASGYRNSRTHPATRTFQALRIAVNDELGQLERALDAAVGLLRPGGRLAIISFHSLEDGRVKRHFRRLAGQTGPRDAYGNPLTSPALRILTRKPLRGDTLDADNPRARSALLRVAERLPA